MGDPVASTGYLLCVYQSRAGVLEVASHARIPAGSCGAGRCWRSTRGGFGYRADGASSDGIQTMTLTERAERPTRIKLGGKGPALADPALPLVQDPTVVVELHRADAPACWSATYGTSRINSTERFTANSD